MERPLSYMSERTDADVERHDTDAEVRERRDSRAVKWASGIASLFGLWIAVSPFLFENTDVALWNDLVVGLAVFLIAGYNYYRLSQGERLSEGAAGLVVLLGLWSVVAPFLFEFGSDELAWSTLISGAVIAVLSGYNAYRSRGAEADSATGARA